MQSAFRIAGEPKRIHQLRRRAQNFFRGELADTDHLKAVIRIGDDVAIFAEDIEDGKAIRCETADPARRFLPILTCLTFEALLAMCQGGTPHVGKIVADNEIG